MPLLSSCCSTQTHTGGRSVIPSHLMPQVVADYRGPSPNPLQSPPRSSVLAGSHIPRYVSMPPPFPTAATTAAPSMHSRGTSPVEPQADNATRTATKAPPDTFTSLQPSPYPWVPNPFGPAFPMLPMYAPYYTPPTQAAAPEPAKPLPPESRTNPEAPPHPGSPRDVALPSLEALEAQYTARLEEKNREIAHAHKKITTLTAALKQTRETFDANFAQLRDCQEMCRRLEGTLAERDVRIHELELYKKDTADRLDNVDTLLRREQEHANQNSESLKRQIDTLTRERSALQGQVVALQETIDKAADEAMRLRREHQREVHLAAQQARAQAELDAEEKIRHIMRPKMEEKDKAMHDLEGELSILRGDVQRERDRAESWRQKHEAQQAEITTLKHTLQQHSLQLDEQRHVRDVEVGALRRENEALRVARDELARVSDSQVRQLVQDGTKRGHDAELLAQQLHAQKQQQEAEQRRCRLEQEDAVRAVELKLRAALDDARQFERQLRASEDQCERLRKQLGDERASRDFGEGEREALNDKISAMQRLVAKRDAEIQRLQALVRETASTAEERAKEAEAVAAELALREAREKRELSVALDTRLKEFRSVGRLRQNATAIVLNASDATQLASRFNEVSALYSQALGGCDDNDQPRTARTVDRHENSTPMRSPAVPQSRHDITASLPTPIQVAHDASNAAIHTMQRVLERQLAAERERNESLQRKLNDVSVSSAMAQQEAKVTMLEDALEQTREAVDSAVTRSASRGRRRVGYDLTTATPGNDSSKPLSPRAEHLRQVTESLKRLPLPPRDPRTPGGS